MLSCSATSLNILKKHIIRPWNFYLVFTFLRCINSLLVKLPKSRIIAHLHSFRPLFFFTPVDSASTFSSISFFPPGLQDSCSPPSQIIPHPKPGCFFTPVKPPSMSSPQPNFASVYILSTPCVHPYPSSLPKSLVCPSQSIFFFPLALLLVFPPSLSAVPFVMLHRDPFCVLGLPLASTLDTKKEM